MPRAARTPAPAPDMRSIVPRGTQWKMCGRIWSLPAAPGAPAFACNARVRPDRMMQHCAEHHAPHAAIAGADYAGDVLWLSPASWRSRCAPPTAFTLQPPQPSRGTTRGAARPPVPPTPERCRAWFARDALPDHFVVAPAVPAPPASRMPSAPQPPLLPSPPPSHQPTPTPPPVPRVLPSFAELLSTLPPETRRTPPPQPPPQWPRAPVHKPFFVRNADAHTRPLPCGRFPGVYCLLPSCPAHACR